MWKGKPFICCKI